LQDQVPNHLKLQGSRVPVVSVLEKAGVRACQVRVKKTNASEPLRTCLKRRDDVETGRNRWLGRSLGETCLLPRRRPA
jgi:hypothetical protein